MSALINSYSSANRVVESDLAVSYGVKKIYGEWSYVSATSIITLYNAWSYTRTAKKSYKYVGMTKSAADSCAAAMRLKYQRTFEVSEWSGTGSEFVDVNGGNNPMADVSVTNTAGDMWQVDVNVSETDSRLRINYSTPSSLFTTEDARDYDTGS